MPGRRLHGGDLVRQITLLLHVHERLAAAGSRVLYVSGEESARQIKIWAPVSRALTNLFILVEISLKQYNDTFKSCAGVCG